MRRFILANMFLSAGIALATMAPAPAAASFNPLSQAYQQSQSASGCTNPGDCAIVFAAVPSKTIVTHVSCIFFLTSDGVVVNALLTEQNAGGQHNSLQTYAFETSSGDTNYGINSETYLIFTKDQEPRIDVYSSGEPVQFLNCTISGFHS